MEGLSCKYLMPILVLAFLVSAIIVKTLIPRITLLAFKRRLFDKLDSRKTHDSNTIPRLGGLSFFPAFFFSVFLSVLLLSHLCELSKFILIDEVEVIAIILSVSVMYILGVVDDIVGVRYRKKFVVQIIISLLLIASGLYMNNFYGFLGLYELPMWFAVPFTLIIYLLIQNSINLIDGIDGLASGLSIIALLGFTFMFLGMHMYVYGIMSMSLAGALFVFFYHNVFGRIGKNKKSSRKIFMGDTGSLTIGLLLGVFVVRISMYDEKIDYSNLPSNIVYAFAFLIIPTFDVVRVFIRRIRTHKNPFLPDKTHIHHKLMCLGFSPRRALLIILFMSLLFGLFSISLSYYLSVNWVLLISVTVWTLLNIVISNKIRAINKCR
ncbi:MAG: MraY family glycosyltransferase [Bacteroides sp.]|nr:MraY family glycosyltransferase [Bacteroides sp.]